jgi:ABC-2 type transport system ATP-binding protein
MKIPVPVSDVEAKADAANPDVTNGALLLEVRNATVQFGNLKAVRDVSFDLHGGDLLGLIGPNGAGKTTLLRALASLQPLRRGEIRVLGEPARPGDEHAVRMIGFTPDVPPTYDAMRVGQFLNFIAAGYGLMPENTAAVVDFWLEKVWLKDKKMQRIGTLSRGMKQRLGIARTMLPNPQIVLLDEPAAGLDPAGRVQFRKLLTDLRDQGKTLIVSSHILSDMEAYCTHIAIMAHGSLMKFGTVREIATGVDDGRCRYAILLAEPVADLADRMATIDELTLVAQERLELTVEYWSDKTRAADLLRRLLEQKLPVAGFSSHRAGLEEAYLRTGIRQVD